MTSKAPKNKQEDIEKPGDRKDENKPQKKGRKFQKILIIALIILFVIALGTCGVLGYLYFEEKEDARALQETSDSLTDQVSSLEEQLNDASKSSSEYLDSIEELEDNVTNLENSLTNQQKENKDLKDDNNQLQEEVDDYEQKQANIKAYNDFFSYLHYLINLRGFDDYTQEEYNTAIAKAQATGDQGLVNAVNALANAPVGDRTDEFATVLYEVTTGIDNNL